MIKDGNMGIFFLHLSKKVFLYVLHVLEMRRYPLDAQTTKWYKVDVLVKQY